MIRLPALCLGLLLSTAASGEALANNRRSVPAVPMQISTHGLTSAQIKDLRCMSLNVYHEARGSTFNNQKGVALVTRNRQRISNQSVCAVVYSPGQFTWTSKRLGPPREADAWLRAQQIAYLVMFSEEIEDITRGATHFHESQIRPVWARRAQTSIRIGAHTFHKLEEIAQVP